MNEEIPDELISKNLTGESTPEEDNKLWEWIERDLKNEKIFNDFVKLYGHRYDLISKDEIEKRLNEIKLHRTRQMSLLWKVAASLLLVCICVGVIDWLDDHVIVKTSFGEVRCITLPDQSRVWLNGGTTIAYHENSFQTTRKVSVAGEVYFEVAKGSGAFLIEYDSIEASLDSGEINIQTYPHELEKIAVVSKGSVTFRDLRKILLEIIASTDHEVISRSDYGLLARSINTNVNFRSWVTGIYVFKDEPIERVISVLGKGDPNLKMNADDLDHGRLISGVFQVDKARKSKEEILRQIDRQIIYGNR